jgi:hypothetical protein
MFLFCSLAPEESNSTEHGCGDMLNLTMCGRIKQKGGEVPGLVTVTLVEEPFPRASDFLI